MKSILTIVCLTIIWMSQPVMAAPTVSVSIKPLYVLVESIMHGIGHPDLVIKSQQSAHHQHFSPRQFSQLRKADIIIRLSPFLETSIQHALSSLSNKEVITLMEISDLVLLPTVAENATCQPLKQGSCNPHLWLNTSNLQKFIFNISESLAKKDPANSSRYWKNATKLRRQLLQFIPDLHTKMKPLSTTRILALHNSWHYFANEFGLTGYQAVKGGDFDHLGTRSILRWKEKIRTGEIDCILVDPENNKKAAIDLGNLNTNVRLVNANPMGSDNVSNILDLLEYTANIFSQCK